MHKRTLKNLPLVIGLLPNDQLVKYELEDGLWMAYCIMGCPCYSNGPTRKKALSRLREKHQQFIDRERKRTAEREGNTRSVSGITPRVRTTRASSGFWADTLRRPSFDRVAPISSMEAAQNSRPNTSA